MAQTGRERDQEALAENCFPKRRDKKKKTVKGGGEHSKVSGTGLYGGGGFFIPEAQGQKETKTPDLGVAGLPLWGKSPPAPSISLCRQRTEY